MNDTLQNAHDADIDTLLTRHFRSAMPDPWPACEALGQARHAARRRNRFRAVSRLALAASIVVFFAAYLTLSGLFPRQISRPAEDPNAIGSVPGKTRLIK